MDKIKNILVAVELDKESEEIIEYGITLGIMLNAHVRCLHVARPFSNLIRYNDEGVLIDEFSDFYEDMDIDSIDEILKESENTLSLMVASVKQRMQLVDFDVSNLVKADFAIPGILNESEETTTDLIIVGAHVDFMKRNQGITNLSKELIERTNKSIIVVPSTYGNRNLDHICMFINFDFDELNMIQDMIDMAKNINVQVSFIHILDEGEIKTDMEDNIDIYRRIFLHLKENPSINFQVIDGDLPDILNTLTNTMEVDLIGLKTKKKHWNLFGLQNSFENKVMKKISVPLFIWRK